MHLRSRGAGLHGRAASACLTPAQVDTARLIYSPIVDAKTKREIPGLAPGQRTGLDRAGLVAVGPRHRARPFPLSGVRRPAVGRAEVRCRHRCGPPLGRSDCRDRRARSDPEAVLRPRRQAAAVPRVERSADHAAGQPGLLRARGRRARRRGGDPRSYRLFMAPGMAHCSGGEGPNDFDELKALEQWVEQGQAPDRILASHRRTGRSTGRVRCARIRRWRATRAPAASTRPRTSSASRAELQLCLEAALKSGSTSKCGGKLRGCAQQSPFSASSSPPWAAVGRPKKHWRGSGLGHHTGRSSSAGADHDTGHPHAGAGLGAHRIRSAPQSRGAAVLRSGPQLISASTTTRRSARSRGRPSSIRRRRCRTGASPSARPEHQPRVDDERAEAGLRRAAARRWTLSQGGAEVERAYIEALAIR